MAPTQDSDAYRRRKNYFADFLTLYGRKPVAEALRDPAVRCARLHLARSNRADPLLDDIVELAQGSGAEVRYHERKALARLSRNGRQDQGVVADIQWRGYQDLAQFLADTGQRRSGPLLALDRIHNPQNLGMLIRATTAGQVSGLLLPRQGCCAIDPLVIKASAGTLFRSHLVHCDILATALSSCREAGYEICVLDSSARDSLFDYRPSRPVLMVLGNETDGISAQTRKQADRALSIPLANGVESLNVAVTGALVAFSRLLAE